MAVAKVFKSGNSRAVRLPKEFTLPIGEVEIFRRGDEVVLRERKRSLADALELLYAMSDEAFEGIKDGRAPEVRDFG